MISESEAEQERLRRLSVAVSAKQRAIEELNAERDDLLNFLFLEDMEWQDNERKRSNRNQSSMMDS